MNRISGLFELAIYGHKGLCTWLNWPSYISLVLLRPPLYIALFGGLAEFTQGRQAAGTVMAGMVVYGGISLLVGGAIQSLGNEVVFGTAPTLLLARRSMASFFTKGIALFPSVAVCYLLTVLSAIAMGWYLPLSTVWPLFASLMAIALSVTCFSLWIGTFSILVKNWLLPTAVVEGLIFGLSGIIIPRQALPLPLRVASDWLPVTHGLEALRQALAMPLTDGVGQQRLLMELGLAAMYGALGLITLGVVKSVCNRSGAVG